MSKDYPQTPMQILGFGDGFWGLNGATGVRIQCFWSQKNGILAHKQMQPKNNFFITPYSLISYFGSLGVPGVQWTWFDHTKLFFDPPNPTVS